MRNKEQEMAWRKVIEACMENVKHHFDDIQQAIEFGCYIQPDNYFVSYIFATDCAIRDGAAERPDGTDQFLSQRAADKAVITPLRESRTAPLPHRRNVTGNLAGIGITISNDTMRDRDDRVHQALLGGRTRG